METTSSMKNKPRLNHMPGLERLDMPTDDFERRETQPLVAWSLAFFALAAASLVFNSVLGGQGSLVFVLAFLFFAALGITALLSRYVRTPP
ncbi:MAG: hypothetical protein ACLFVJ_07455 [Persicimonas sp.]